MENSTELCHSYGRAQGSLPRNPSQWMKSSSLPRAMVLHPTPTLVVQQIHTSLENSEALCVAFQTFSGV